MVLVATLIGMVLAQSPTMPLSGTVVGPTGEPMAEAVLILAGMPLYDPPILARGRSDGEGRFRLQRPVGLSGRNRFIAPILWVVKPGLRLAFRKFPGAMPAAGEPVRIVLGPPGKAEVRVEGPNGEPIAGARVRVERFGRESTNVPDDVVDLIEATTDQDGLAVIDAAANDEVAYIDVHSQAFGIQGRWSSSTGPKPKRVRLRPATSLKGRLVADDPTIAKGWRVFAYTRPSDGSSPDPETTGFARGTTDVEGRFSFPVIAPGSLQLVLKPPGDLPVLPDLPRSLAVVTGRENSLEVPLRTAATIAGIVRDRDTGTPVPGVKLWLVPSGGGESGHAESDGQGRYTFRTFAHKAQVIVTDAPPSHVRIGGSDRKEFTVPEAPGRIDLAPIEIPAAAPPLRFVVRDESGKPVVGARITGQSASGMVMETTEASGEFTVGGVAPGGEVTIEAQRFERMTAEPVKATAGGTDPVIVTIVPGQTLALAGRVLGPGGTPVAGASLKVEFRKVESDGRLPYPQPFRFEDSVEVLTGPDGTFQTPKELSRKARDFRVETTAEGFLSKESGWVSSAGGDRVTVPDLTLRRSLTLRFLSGRVVDRAGTGVAGASVYQSGNTLRRTATTTDSEGRFRLAGVPDAAAFVFAEKPGYRFGGTIVKPADAQVDVRLARVDEPPLSMPKSLPPLLTRAEDRAMAKELLAPRVDAAPSGKAVLATPAWLDPDRLLEMLENRVLEDPSQVLIQIAVAQLETDPDAAVATIELDHDPASRAEGFLAVADATPITERARRIRLIERALGETRRVETNKEIQIELLGHIADCWLDLNDVDRATSVIREGWSIITTARRDQAIFTIEKFADLLALIDLPTARTIWERKEHQNVGATDAITLNHHFGEAAVRLAAINPAEAERLVPAVVPGFWDDSRADYVLRICRRMARVDLPRARKILDTIDQPTGPASYPRPARVPYGLGLMASELAATDPATARGLLDEALSRLPKVAYEQADKETDPPASGVLAGLLPLVERLEPDRLEERLWLTAACRAPLAQQPDMSAVQVRVTVAMWVAHYDRAMAATIIAPALERLPELLADTTGIHYMNNSPPIAALTAYDPRAVAELIRILPDSAKAAPAKRVNLNHSDVPPPGGRGGGNKPSLEIRIRLKAVEMLGFPIEERRRKASGWSDEPWPVRGVRRSIAL